MLRRIQARAQEDSRVAETHLTENQIHHRGELAEILVENEQRAIAVASAADCAEILEPLLDRARVRNRTGLKGQSPEVSAAQQPRQRATRRYARRQNAPDQSILTISSRMPCDCRKSSTAFRHGGAP